MRSSRMGRGSARSPIRPSTVPDAHRCSRTGRRTAAGSWCPIATGPPLAGPVTVDDVQIGFIDATDLRRGARALLADDPRVGTGHAAHAVGSLGPGPRPALDYVLVASAPRPSAGCAPDDHLDQGELQDVRPVHPTHRSDIEDLELVRNVRLVHQPARKARRACPIWSWGAHGDPGPADALPSPFAPPCDEDGTMWRDLAS